MYILIGASLFQHQINDNFNPDVVPTDGNWKQCMHTIMLIQLWFTIILRDLVVFDFFQFNVVMINEVIVESIEFFVILLLFMASYAHMLIQFQN